MNDVVYTYDHYRHLPVKIVRLGKKWRVFHLKEVLMVEVLFSDSRQSEIRYKVVWEEKQRVQEWNRELAKYCDYYTYQPYEEKDAEKQVTLEMIEYTKCWQSHLVHWRIPTTVKDYQLVSINGFSLMNYRLGKVNKDATLAGYERLTRKINCPPLF